MSRRPDPIEKRVGKGNTQRRPLPANAPARVPGTPAPPDWLQGHALTCWRKTAALLAARGQLSADSEISLLALCTTFDEWVTLAQDLRDHGRFQRVKTKAGAGAKGKASYMERTRPAVAMFADCDRRLKGWLVEFGLTDASRGKVSGMPPEDGDDPLEPYAH
jgi:P27 family predicted phage terminase small subunit